MFTYIISLVITAGLSVYITLIAPKLKRVIIQRKTNKKRKLEALVSAEVTRQLKNIIND
jgi:hypothetical protein